MYHNHCGLCALELVLHNGSHHRGSLCTATRE